MKLTPILIAFGMILPATASAESLNDTHVRVWHPSGKTPAATYRPRAKTDCTRQFENARADKAKATTPTRCVRAAGTPWNRLPTN